METSEDSKMIPRNTWDITVSFNNWEKVGLFTVLIISVWVLSTILMHMSPEL